MNNTLAVTAIVTIILNIVDKGYTIKTPECCKDNYFQPINA